MSPADGGAASKSEPQLRQRRNGLAATRKAGTTSELWQAGQAGPAPITGSGNAGTPAASATRPGS